MGVFLRESDWASSCEVPFIAKKLRHPSVTWLNKRWFLERGVDVLNCDALVRVKVWLLNQFAYSVPQSHDSPELFCPDQRTFYADRYGGFGIGFHGGSGRTGRAGRFQIKGIGITPLVSAFADEFHLHGSVSLEEAIREAVFAEIAHHEMPFGGIPVIAIILTGTRMRWRERKALVVRPTFFRASYLERAPFYRPTHGMILDHMQDVERVRHMMCTLVARSENPRRRGDEVEKLRDFMSRAAAQLAFSHANRLYFGPFATSNLTIDGNLFDYGSARALDNWARSTTVNGAPAFGVDDLAVLEKGCEDILFYCKKYAPATGFSQLDGSVHAFIESQYKELFRNELLALFGLTPSDWRFAEVNSIYATLLRHFKDQQRIKINLLSKEARPYLSWFSDDSFECKEPAASGQEACILRAIREALSSAQSSRLWASKCIETAKRTLAVRPLLVREVIQSMIYANVVEEGGDGGTDSEIAKQASSFIERVVSVSRRVFKGLPERLTVCGAVTNTYSSALYCKDFATGSKFIALSGTKCRRSWAFFQQSIPRGTTKANGSEIQDQWITIAVPGSYGGNRIDLQLNGTTISVPKMDLAYLE